MIIKAEDHLEHYGTPRKSGRYPWGSGSPESTRNRSFLDAVDKLKKEGYSETEIAKGMGMSSKNELVARRSIALSQQRQEKIQMVERLAAKGMSNGEIAKRMGLAGESSVRALRAPGAKDKADVLETTVNMLKAQIEEKGYIDVGKGVEYHIGVSRDKLNTAIVALEQQGYSKFRYDLPQLTTSHKTTTKVLGKPGAPFPKPHELGFITDYSDDGGRNFFGLQPPIQVSSRRVGINYKENGGDKADGVIYVRPGVKDLQIGSNNYGQVRIGIDGTHYLKGMAMYKDDLPAGVDLVFNTNKSNTGNKHDAMKPNEPDKDNPFGAIVRQIHDKDGKVVSAMNMVGSPTKEGSGEEGQWDKWSKTLSRQMLSKQEPSLAKNQLDVTFENRMREFNEIKSLTNPSVRAKLLKEFSDSTDAAAVHMKAANLPRQATKVLMPIPSMKPTEVYCPTLDNGERVSLIRFPHSGTFEIPQLTVNNRNREAIKLLGPQAKDAIGIHHSVAERLSGADFDGDTVLAIPNNKKLVKSTDPLEGLKGFDPQVYKIPEGSDVPRMTSGAKGHEMGKITNLIADMTLKGATEDDLARAVRHSMVVIDAEKHGLDYRASYKANGIAALNAKYRGKNEKGRVKTGASTLITRAKSPIYLPERRERKASEGGPIDPATGKKVFVETGRIVPVRNKVVDKATGKVTYVDTGKTELKRTPHQGLSVVEDAHTLSSGTVIETIYANHSNKLKALANESRKEMVATKPMPYNKSAAKTYSKEVDSLVSKIALAERNAPLERQAQAMARVIVSQKRQANPFLETAEIKKIKQQALNESRRRTGANKHKITPTQEEWNAIQAGALSPNRLDKVLTHGDTDAIRALALPKTTPKMTSAKQARAQAMINSGYTQAEIAKALGVSLTTLKVSISE